MNPIRAIEKIREIERLSDQKIPASPLLTLPQGWYEMQWGDAFKSGFVSAVCLDGKIRMPFDVFRYSLPPCPVTESDPEPYIENYGVVCVHEEKIEQLGFLSFRGKGGKIETQTFRTSTNPNEIKGDSLASTFEVLLNGKWFRTPIHDPLALGVMVRPLLILSWFYFSGMMQPVRVSPSHEKSAGRSREWIQAREFYTVVHRRHAANVKGIASGASIADKSAALTAHSRRAHTRILRSPKWGANMGKILWVRSCWVGPKEWRDAESMQVYRIAELPSR